MSIDWEALRAPFALSQIEWRLIECGKNANGVWAICAPYITNRAIMDRLDDVVGAGNWRNEFRAGPDGGVLCGIFIRVDNEWIGKHDGAGNTDIEGVKGGLSNAMKRAAVQWGIGRYLYDLDLPWATIEANGRFHGKTKDGERFKWTPPRLPEWAVSGKPQPEQPAEPKANGRGKPSNKPGDEISWVSKALASIKSAPDLKVWQRYKAAIEKRIEQGEGTPEEVKLLEAAIAMRGGELGAEPEPEGVDEPAEPKVNWPMLKSLALRTGCPEDEVDGLMTIAETKDDPIAFVKSKPWASKPKVRA